MYLALVLLGSGVNVGDHGSGVGHQHRVHQAPGHHAHHNDPHLHIIYNHNIALQTQLQATFCSGAIHLGQKKKLLRISYFQEVLVGLETG